MNATDRSFLFLLGSSRPDGNTEALARIAGEQLPSEVEQRWIALRDVPLPAFVDRRHSGDPKTEPTGDERMLLDATFAATDIVIASPLYWYSVSAATKLYLDYWSGWMSVPSLAFKQRMAGKTLWAVSVISEEEDDKADPLVNLLRLSADYLSMTWGGTLLGNASRPGQIHNDGDALSRAKTFFGR